MNKAQELEEDATELEQVKYTKKSDLDCLIEDFLEEARNRDTTPKMQVYKFENDKSGNAREFCGYFTGEEIPDKHHIGLLYGGGRYFIHLKQPKGKSQQEENTCLVMKISNVYNELKARHDEERRIEDAQKRAIMQNPLMPMMMPQPSGTPPEAFTMMKDMLAMLLPLLRQQQPAPVTQAAAPDLLGQYAIMQKVLSKNLFDTAENYRSFTRRFMQDDQDQDDTIDSQDTATQEPSIMEKIIKMIEPFFSLIAQKGSAAQLAAQGMRSAPQFAELLSDPTLCRMIVQHFDRTKGVQASDIALQNLGINRQKLFAAANSGAPGGHAASQPHQAAARTPETLTPGKTTKKGRQALKPA